MSKSAKTKYTSTNPHAIHLSWKIKRINEAHTMRQAALAEEYKAKSLALTQASQVEQNEVFKALATTMGLDAKNFETGGWALDIESLDYGEVSLVQQAQVNTATEDDGCQCVVCQVRRALAGSAPENGDDFNFEAPVLH